MFDANLLIKGFTMTYQQYMKKYHSFRKIQQIHNTGIGRT